MSTQPINVYSKASTSAAVAACALVALLGFSDAWAEQKDFCAAFKEPYKVAFKGFRPLRGAYDQDFEEFASTVVFPHAAHCEIEEDEFDFTYHCSWQYGADAQALAVKEAKQLAAGIRQCLASKKPRSAWMDELGAASESIWRDEIPDNDNRALSTKIYVSRSPERRARHSGRVYPAYISTRLAIEYKRNYEE